MVTVRSVTLRERCFLVYILTVMLITLIFSFVCNGWIDIVTGTLIFSLNCNGYIDNVM